MGLGLDQPTHWLVIIALALVLFGYKKLPEMARSTGRSLRIFKTELKGMADDDEARNQSAVTTAQAADAQLTDPKAAEIKAAEDKAAALKAQLLDAERQAAALKAPAAASDPAASVPAPSATTSANGVIPRAS